VRRLALACVLVLSACSGESAADQRVGEGAIAALIADAGTEQAFNDRLCEFRQRLWDEIDARNREQVDREMVERLTTDPPNKTVVRWLERLAGYCLY